MRKAFLFWLMMLAAGLGGGMLGGCKSVENGMFSPRSGEMFQTTRQGLGEGSRYGTALFYGGLMSRDPLGLLVAVVGSPFALASVALDEGVFSPLTDIMCLPYDLCRPNHGFYIQIVDEDGKPLPDANLDGWVKNAGDFSSLSYTHFAGTTDAAGEFYVSRLFNLQGGLHASGPGCMPWFYPRKIKPENLRPGADGRIVLRYVVRKSSLGGWKAKADVEREELMSKLPGKWSADVESRKMLIAELGWPSAKELSRHCFTLDRDGSVASQVPERYRAAHYDGSPWGEGPKFSRWQLLRKGEKKSPWHARELKAWKWAVRLSKTQERRGIEEDYYLGEDEKGLYLAPGFRSESRGPEVVLKFRKAKE